MKELSPTGYYHTWRLGAKYLPKFPKVKPVESQDDPPPGWEEGFEHYRHYFRCTVCNEWKHESEMKHRLSGGFICNKCNSEIDQLINRL